MKQIVIIISVLFLVTSCGNRRSDKQKTGINSLTDNTFSAVGMPSELITGNPFPTDSTFINSWVKQSTSKNNLETNKDMINHGWAIWQALTEMTNQSSNDQILRRFETWYTPTDIIDAYKMRNDNPEAKLKHVKRHTGSLEKFNQLHGNVDIQPEDQSVVGFVKYDPSAAEHIYKNNLFYVSTLNSMLKKNQIANIPDFPTSGVVLKPVFATLDSISPETGLYIMPVWPGDEGDPNRPFGSNQWDNYVSITIDGKTNAKEHTYSINDFISFKLDSVQAATVGGKTGDYAVLQAMHVTTREIKRWTWQTFWWSEYNDTPQGPSSSSTASLRPKSKLDGAANHYAMSIVYSMVQPAQPYNGGSGANATSLYAYNPYLEAGFGTSTFTRGNDTIQKYYSPDYQKVGGFLNQYGMQSNCMSCHGQARYIPEVYGENFYITDQYFELNAPYFKNTVKLDFSWAIQGNLINDNEESLE